MNIELFGVKFCGKVEVYFAPSKNYTFKKRDTNGIEYLYEHLFDQGNTCMEAIYNFIKNRDCKTYGKIGEKANPNYEAFKDEMKRFFEKE